MYDWVTIIFTHWYRKITLKWTLSLVNINVFFTIWCCSKLNIIKFQEPCDKLTSDPPVRSCCRCCLLCCCACCCWRCRGRDLRTERLHCPHSDPATPRCGQRETSDCAGDQGTPPTETVVKTQHSGQARLVTVAILLILWPVAHDGFSKYSHCCGVNAIIMYCVVSQLIINLWHNELLIDSFGTNTAQNS